jgi:hypothetical protein
MRRVKSEELGGRSVKREEGGCRVLKAWLPLTPGFSPKPHELLL